MSESESDEVEIAQPTPDEGETRTCPKCGGDGCAHCFGHGEYRVFVEEDTDE